MPFAHRVFAVLFVLCAACGTTTKTQLRDTLPPAPAMTLEDLELRKPVDDGAGGTKCADPLLRPRVIEKFHNGKGGTFTVGVIELADDGHVADDNERDAVLGELKTLACAGSEECKSGPGALIVTFVHGWHHRAKVCDNNLACFRRVIRALSAAEQARGEAAGQTPRPVFGLYLAWRGDNLKKATFLSFYNRKSTAHHIGAHGGKEILLDLDEVYRTLNEKLATPARRHPVTLVTVGHSFGGALVYSAIEGKLVRELKSHHNVGRPAKDGVRPVRPGVGDLVVLVNPAFEAYRYRHFADDLVTQGRYADDQLPVLLTVASSADMAVRGAFPAGRTLYFTAFPWELENISNIIGAGHYDPQTTHDLIVTVNDQKVTLPPIAKVKTTEADQATKDRCELDTSTGDLATCECIYPVPDEQELLRQMAGPAAADLVGGAGGSIAVVTARRQEEAYDTQNANARVTLRPRSGSWDPRTPFVVARATGDIISGHSEIYNPRFVTFLVGYISDFLREQARTGK